MSEAIHNPFSHNNSRDPTNLKLCRFYYSIGKTLIWQFNLNILCNTKNNLKFKISIITLTLIQFNVILITSSHRLMEIQLKYNL